LICLCILWIGQTDNVLKAVAEAQLFLTLLLSIVLRFSKEELGNDLLDDNQNQYGTILVVAFFSAPSVRGNLDRGSFRLIHTAKVHITNTDLCRSRRS
jgi:hypothetical protein